MAVNQAAIDHLRLDEAFDIETYKPFNDSDTMTTMDLRAAISNDMNGFTPDMLQMVAEYVKSLRRRQSQPQ